jgi:hypothetical protein
MENVVQAFEVGPHAVIDLSLVPFRMNLQLNANIVT